MLELRSVELVVELAKGGVLVVYVVQLLVVPIVVDVPWLPVLEMRSVETVVELANGGVLVLKVEDVPTDVTVVLLPLSEDVLVVRRELVVFVYGGSEVVVLLPLVVTVPKELVLLSWTELVSASLLLLVICSVVVSVVVADVTSTELEVELMLTSELVLESCSDDDSVDIVLVTLSLLVTEVVVWPVVVIPVDRDPVDDVPGTVSEEVS